MMSEDVPLERDENGVLTYIVHMKYFREEDERLADVRASKSGQKRDAQGRFKRQKQIVR